MPKDKTATHEKILLSLKHEFIEHGYEKASLQNIAKNVGITPAGLYRHFPSKEAMFTAMVEPTTSEFFRNCRLSMQETYTHLDDADFWNSFNTFRAAKNRELLRYMYDHLDVFKMLLLGSKGTSYENFQDQLIKLEVDGIKDMIHALDKRGLPNNKISDNELHILAAMFITAICETIKQEYPRESAFKYSEFIGQMLYPGIKVVLGF